MEEVNNYAKQRFVGGLWTGAISATWPFGELLLDEAGVHLRLRLVNRVARWVHPIEIPWSDLESVELVQGGIPLPLSKGVRFVQRGGAKRPRVVFWCGARRRDAITEVLRGRGVSVVKGNRVWST